ncbi:unnamed protein product [Acanthoscelides obtectus]|uniref:Uncharacterized protein n=1 Tax=Acanthoscelides obtectus TaxID=200917 RepID=A0A9P0Q4R5_ACAOB|nr:unnamed protein product [Acanthoscelides obtectus]CAK1675720.1 hypothetical protein AOBTE_LOCUS30388 [Acanthoscelides obtectus]
MEMTYSIRLVLNKSVLRLANIDIVVIPILKMTKLLLFTFFAILLCLHFSLCLGQREVDLLRRVEERQGESDYGPGKFDPPPIFPGKDYVEDIFNGLWEIQ